MRRLAAAFAVSVALTGCSTAATPESSGGLPDPSQAPVEFDCGSVPGSHWRSLELLVGGETPEGGHAMEHWGIEFKEGEARWWHTDVVADVPYRCESGKLTAGEAWHKIDPEAVMEGDRLLMRWHGDLYERVDSFYDIP